MKTHILLTSVVLLIPGLVSCGKKKEETTATPEISVARPIVDSVVLHKTYPGYIRAGNSVDVSCLVNGRLEATLYKEGTYVKKGQVLFRIEPTKYRDAVQQATASLATARSQYEYYSKQYAAMKKAYEADAVSEMELLQAQSSMESAQASIQNAQAALETARTNLGYCTIYAPMSGHISIAAYSPGNYLQGEASPVKLCTIYEDDVMKATFQIEESQFRAMEVNKDTQNKVLYKAIPLKFNPELSVKFTADLSYTSPAVNTGTGTLNIEGLIPNKESLLKDGMFVSVDLPYGVDPKAILIRDASIGRDQLGSYVYLVNDSNKVVYTSIETGELYADTLRIVTKGIKAGDRYVTDAMLTVRNGETVKPIEVK